MRCHTHDFHFFRTLILVQEYARLLRLADKKHMLELHAVGEVKVAIYDVIRDPFALPCHRQNL